MRLTNWKLLRKLNTVFATIIVAYGLVAALVLVDHLRCQEVVSLLIAVGVALAAAPALKTTAQIALVTKSS